MPRPENGGNLTMNGLRVRHRGVSVIVKARTSAMMIPAREMVRHQKQHLSSLMNPIHHILRQHFPQMRPTQIKAATQVSEGHENTHRRFRCHRNIDAPIHALEHSDGRRMLTLVTRARQHGFGAPIGLTVAFGQAGQPIDSFLYRLQVNITHTVLPLCA